LPRQQGLAVVAQGTPKVFSPVINRLPRNTKKVVDSRTKKTTLQPANQNKQSINKKFFAKFFKLPFSV